MTAISRGFLSRLAHDARSDTLAIVAMAMAALVRLIDGCIDISRMYITKTRPQHACDAGSSPGASRCLQNLHADREEQPQGGLAW
ncbi:MAG: hypothetical protein ABI471_04095 [Sphingomonas bacterium]